MRPAFRAALKVVAKYYLIWHTRAQKYFSAGYRLPAIGAAVFALILFFGVLIGPPRDFPTENILRIERGSTLSETAAILAEERVIHYPVLFRFASVFFGTESGVRAGEYQFHKPKNVFSVARQIMTGNFGLTMVPVTVQEGATVADIAALFLPEQFPHFDHEKFLREARPLEGYLFPDTYLFLPTTSEQEVFAALRQNFEKKNSRRARLGCRFRTLTG